MNAGLGGGAMQVLLPLLGIVGVFAIVLLPWRVWRLLRGDVPLAWRVSLLGRILATIATIACVALLSVWLQLLLRASQCAFDAVQCGTASPWWYMALMGAGYLAFEIACWPLRRALRNIGLVAHV